MNRLVWKCRPEFFRSKNRSENFRCQAWYAEKFW